MEEVIDISKVLNLLKRNWKFIVSLSLLGALIAAAISFFLIKPTYSASTQILVNNKASEDRFELQANQTDLQLINTYNEIIKSPVILDKVAKNLNVNNDLASKISVSNATQSKVITISANAKNYSDAAKIVNETAYVFSKEVGKIMKTDNVTVLTKADENLKASPVKPKPLLNTIIGLILGLIISLVLIIINNLLDKRVKTENDVQEILNLPVIGMIPHFDEKTLK
ncbi:Wzz/FepE/Etk N-terminal domain-containing protein [Macrococcus armenti]|uniref:Wzz/FepE/Etk N-terminal domain-containing protein n=1 Tax=Macrococcus armenti TaxID=2875764 RepID=UPI001CCAB88A|nr:Wzz/FepE/Etk N-terminal domain-containing protein [Macrococcus armenti]UBH16121.1 capsule biosynthesis protein CapA [Macrococcus armenti]UBH18481.1 capsule biosynthesis protein CapA [Macrococcus armenti]UBH20748.1 capsule biosynthesis protein CapA [Macrococcus armenti]